MPASDALRSIIQQAVLAPSSHNTQPWRFRVTAQSIDLLADRTRALPVNDPYDRELVISCGAALMALRAAAAAAGLGLRVHLLPDSSDTDWLARVEMTSDPVDADLAALAPFIEQRRTCRKAFGSQEVGPDVMAAIEAAAAQEGASLLSLDAAQREAAGELVAEGDRAQWNDPRWRRELARWMRPRRNGDGLTVPGLAAPIARAVVRIFDMGKGAGARDRKLLIDSPWISVLTTTEDDVRSWLYAGQALQRALLVGCRHGLQASYLNQPIQLSALRTRLQSVLRSADYPQMLMRWGYPSDVPLPAPRRPLDAVIQAAGLYSL